MWEVIQDLVAGGTTLLLRRSTWRRRTCSRTRIVVIDHGRIIARARRTNTRHCSRRPAPPNHGARPRPAQRRATPARAAGRGRDDAGFYGRARCSCPSAAAQHAAGRCGARRREGIRARRRELYSAHDPRRRILFLSRSPAGPAEDGDGRPSDQGAADATRSATDLRRVMATPIVPVRRLRRREAEHHQDQARP